MLHIWISVYSIYSNPFSSSSFYHVTVMRGDPQNWNLFIKNCVFILTHLNFSHLQSTLHVMQYIYRDFFSSTQKFLKSFIFMPFSASAVFCFTSSPSAKRFSLKIFFIWGNKQTNKKSHLWHNWVTREGGAWRSCCFLSTAAGHSVQCGQVSS